jgi:hypothetical protein
MGNIQMLNMFNSEWLETLLAALALIIGGGFRVPIPSRGCASVYTGSTLFCPDVAG